MVGVSSTYKMNSNSYLSDSMSVTALAADEDDEEQLPVSTFQVIFIYTLAPVSYRQFVV